MMNIRNQTDPLCGGVAETKQVERALESIAEGEHDFELYFDARTGQLRARGDRDEDGEDTDRLPATQMAREGFFADGGRLPGMSRWERLDVEKRLLSSELPWLRFRFQHLADLKRCGLVCELKTDAGNSYTLWVRIRKAFPNKPPKLYIVDPKPLRDCRGKKLSSYHSSAEMHLLPADRNGHPQICHYSDSHWTTNVTLYKVVLKARLWLHAYELHKARGQDIDRYLRHMGG